MFREARVHRRLAFTSGTGGCWRARYKAPGSHKGFFKPFRPSEVRIDPGKAQCPTAAKVHIQMARAAGGQDSAAGAFLWSVGVLSLKTACPVCGKIRFLH